MSIVSRLLRTDGAGGRTPGDAGRLMIQPMRRRHIRPALVIEEQCYPKPWTAGVFGSEIDLARRGMRYYAVLTDDDQVVGYGGLMFAPDEAHITNIAIHPDRRRGGLGRVVLRHLIDVARKQECDALTLEVRVSNTAAQNLYRSFGFAPVGVRQRYYENSEDALVMWAHDIRGEGFSRRLDDVSRDMGQS